MGFLERQLSLQKIKAEQDRIAKLRVEQEGTSSLSMQKIKAEQARIANLPKPGTFGPAAAPTDSLASLKNASHLREAQEASERASHALPAPAAQVDHGLVDALNASSEKGAEETAERAAKKAPTATFHPGSDKARTDLPPAVPTIPPPPELLATIKKLREWGF